MADKKWRLGDLEFDTEKEYLDASADLKKIKEIMRRHDTATPAGARAALKEIRGKQAFSSSYGQKFVEKLEKTAGASGPAAISESGSKNGGQGSRPAPPPKEKKKKVHIITKRNIAIGLVIIVLLVAARFVIPMVAPGLFGGQEATGDEKHRNLVLAYAKNQVDLQRDFYNYYETILGQDSDAARASANARLSEAYCINLADEDVEAYSDQQIEDIYVKLITAGELVNDSFNEPQAITDLKSEIARATAGLADSGQADVPQAEPVTEADVKVGLVNRMMDYQQRTAAQLAYGYRMFDMTDAEAEEYAAEDMEKIFKYVIYDMTLSDSEKESYYDLFLSSGFFNGDTLSRIDSSPVRYNLPDLTPAIKILGADGTETAVECSQQTLAPAACVAYELHAGGKEGYMLFRGNGTGIDFVQDDDGNSVVTQGDFFLKWDETETAGEWYYNSAKIGFLVSDQKAGGVQYVYDIEY